MSARAEDVVRLEHVAMRYGDHVVYENVDLAVRRGERLGLVGGSGSGKSTLLRQIIGLQAPSSGRVRLFGEPLYSRGGRRSMLLGSRFGVLFQAGALFTDLTVYDNIALPLRELRALDESLIGELVFLKLRLVGLEAGVAQRMPYELSGGMTKRAALARALALEPELLLLDEPTSGLDPVGSDNFIRVLADLHRDLGFTLILVTHDLLTLPALCDRVAVLAAGKLAALGTLDEVMASQHPSVHALFHGERGRRVLPLSTEEAAHV